jgi:pimeloyl-ACP methyl ester carboxylesterase
MQTKLVKTPRGRRLCLEIAGDPAGRPVLVCAGTPNSRHLYSRWIEDATAREIRLIGYDRPGYGDSDPDPGHSVADGAADVRAIAEALGIERLAVWGYSGGGPFALACAALLPELVSAVATIGSLAPYGAPGLDFFTGMGEENVEDTRLFFSDPGAAREKTRQDREEELQVTPEQLTEAWKTLLSPADAAVLSDEYAEYVVNCVRAGLAPGDQGWWDDAVAHLSPWGFNLDSIVRPVKICHGRQDRFVPFQHGEWLAANVPGAEAHLTAEDGHLTMLVEGIPRIHSWLLSQA